MVLAMGCQTMSAHTTTAHPLPKQHADEGPEDMMVPAMAAADEALSSAVAVLEPGRGESVERRGSKARPKRMVGPLTRGAIEARTAVDFVIETYRLNGVDLASEVVPSLLDLYREAYHHGRLYHTAYPTVGDLVFFHNTHDRDRDGRWDDWLTFVAIVESVSRDGTITALGFAEGRVQRVYLNLMRPDVSVDKKGRTLNSVLREGNPQGPKRLRGTAGRLFAGFGNLLGVTDQVTVMDNWRPARGRVATPRRATGRRDEVSMGEGRVRE